MKEKTVLEEARNIARNAPVWPGDTISHASVEECRSRGWVTRDYRGWWIPTSICPFTVVRDKAERQTETGHPQ